MKCPVCQAESEFGVILCQCGFNLFTGEQKDRAKTARGNVGIAPAPDPSLAVDDDGTWICPCGVTNEKDNERCRGCGYSLRQTKIILESPLGADDPRLSATWKCRCGKENTISAANCTLCGMPQAEILEEAIARIDRARKEGLNWDRIIKYCVILGIWKYFVGSIMALVNLFALRGGHYFNKQLLGMSALARLVTPVAVVNYLVFVSIFACLARAQTHRAYEHAMFVAIGVKAFDLAMELLLGRNFVGRLGAWLATSIILCSAAVVGVWVGKSFSREREA